MTYNEILQRTVNMLQEDETVARIAREITLVPTGPNTSNLTPAVHVILSSPYSTSESVGYTGETATQYTEKIEMKIIVSKTAVKQAVLQLNDLMEAVYDVFIKNRRLASPDGSDPMFVRSVVDIRADAKNTGQVRQTATVTITGQVGEDITLKIKDLDRRLYVLYSSGNADDDDYAPHKDYAGELKGYARTGRRRPRMYEIENVPGTYEDLKPLLDTLLTFNATHHSEAETFKGYLKRIVRNVNYNVKPVITLEIASI